MKVIDLLNKIANGEEVPKKVKYRDEIYEYDELVEDYINNTDYYLFDRIKSCSVNAFLNFEIIEEQQDLDIQELKELEMTETINSKLVKEIREHRETINKLVQAVKQLDKKTRNLPST